MRKLPWILSGVLVLVMLVRLVGCSSEMDEIKRSRVWHVSAESISVRQAKEEELPEDARATKDYYVLEMQLTNNSTREADIDGNISVKPKQGESWAVRTEEDYSNASFRKRSNIPVGCTGSAQVLIAVDPEEMIGDEVQVIYDGYSPYPCDLGTVKLPKAYGK